MTNLSLLHRGIRKVRRFRSVARMGSGVAQWITAAGWLLLLTFGLDWLTQMDSVERIVLLAIEAFVLVWLFKKYLLPALRVRESLIGLAAQIEMHQDVHSDLVAALQFNDTVADQFGSEELRARVVEDTARLSSGIDYLFGFSRPELWKNLARGTATVLVVAAVALYVPDYFNIFLQRLTLQEHSYPTNTVILSLDTVETNAVVGRPVTFVVRVDTDKVVPEAGILKIFGENDAESELALLPGGAPGEFTVTLPRVIDEFEVSALVGDDESARQKINILKVPRIELAMNAEIPQYAVESFNVKSTGGRIQSVLAGSNVSPSLTSSKPLKVATIQLGEESFELKQEGDRWVMPVDDHPLIGVESTTKYQISVTDTDGISPDRPITGILQVRPDQNPRIAAATVINLVLSKAAPRIKFRAIDDFGIDRIAADITITRVGMDTSEDTITKMINESDSHAKLVDDTVPIDLAEYDLEIGDTVLVTLQVTDYRGQQEGITTASDPIEFTVTSRANFLAAMRDIDSETDEKLDQIIKAQLGVGDRQ